MDFSLGFTLVILVQAVQGATSMASTNFSWVKGLAQHRAIVTLPESHTPGAATNFSWVKGLGQHRAIVTLPELHTPGAAAFATVPWQRRAVPNTTTTAAVLTVASTGTVVGNVVRAPAGPGITDSEALTFVFMPTAEGAPPPPPPGPNKDGWVVNSGTATKSIVTACSGSQTKDGLACWKAVDGKMLFNDQPGKKLEGWDGLAGPGGVEWLEMDLGAAPTSPMNRFGIYSVSKGDDPQWWPTHNPKDVSLLGRRTTAEPWTALFNGSLVLDPETGTNVIDGWQSVAGKFRYYRFEISSRGKGDPSHSYIKEVQFGHAPPAGPPPPPPPPPPPAPMATEYALYYMPYRESGSQTGLSLQAHYIPHTETADSNWLERHNLSKSCLSDGSFRARLPEALSVSLESETPFQSFEPMEVVATEASVAAMVAKHKESVLFFPTDRSNQIKMLDKLPQIWADSGPSKLLAGSAEKGEMFAFQLGVWNNAPSNFTLLPDDISWTELRSDHTSIPANATRCFNLGGVDYRGSPFEQTTTVQPHGIGALWFGVDVPDTLPAGNYTGAITVNLNAANQQKVDLQVSLTVQGGTVIRNAGADDLWRMSRLGWLDSQVGIDRNITSGFDALKLSDNVATLSGGRTVKLNPSSAGGKVELIESIAVHTQPVVVDGVSFSAAGVKWAASSAPSIVQQDNMSATITTTTPSSDGVLELNTSTVVSFDGFIDVTFSIASKGAKQRLPNSSMTLTIPEAASTFFMGLAQTGGNRSVHYPDGIVWNWKQNKGGENQLWAGSGSAGLRVKLKGIEFDWDSPLHMQSDSSTPKSWGGDDESGGVTALPSDKGLEITASTGPVSVSQEPLVFRFDLLVTPTKQLDTPRHFRRDRYYQYGYNGLGSPAQIAGMGTEILNLHQGVDLNPYINYPFNPVAMERQANFSNTAKSLGVKSTCIYYTTRELSNRCYEMPTLRALATPTDHFFDSGSGGGASWLQEHLQSDYHVRWSTGLRDGESPDAAIADTSLTRWENYYIQGLQWLTQPQDNPTFAAIDGLYLDELSFDRQTMMRMRKAVDQHRSGCLFDLHSCNKYHCGVPSAPHACSALIYMAHFAFLDSIWFGEGFSPDYPPDQWLVEMSGIPFGIHAEQLTSPNLWRGMVFAEGARPAPDLWKAWDSLGLVDDGVALVGWWEPNPLVTVTEHSGNSSDPVVFASVYWRSQSSLKKEERGQNMSKKPRAVVAVASWAKTGSISCTLNIDWARLGLSASNATITASAIDNFQGNLTVESSRPTIEVPAAKGWLLAIDGPAAEA